MLRHVFATALMVFAVTGGVGQDAVDPAPNGPEQPDAICKALFDEYIVRVSKIPGDDITAAIQLIASRGRERGFWRTVLAELKADNEQSEVGCVRILGRMLEVDATARDVIQRERETGDVGQWIARVCLDEEVVDVLLARADAADRFRLPHYLVALARSRDPRVTGLFLKVIQGKHEEGFMEGAQFHAALGLAERGDRAGVEWLIAHVEDQLGDVFYARPAGASRQNVGVCCVAALRVLSGEAELETAVEWQAWWFKAKADFKPARHVPLSDR